MVSLSPQIARELRLEAVSLGRKREGESERLRLSSGLGGPSIFNVKGPV